ncbi:MAG: hypothetical protein AAFP24_12295, partial [Pseudomonadota bacterium]
VVTIITFILIGWWGTQWLSENRFLVLETTVVTTDIAAAGTDAFGAPIAALEGGASTLKATNIPCGSTIDHGLYALDMFIPLIEIDQDNRCMIRPFDSTMSKDGMRAPDLPYSEIWRPSADQIEALSCDPLRQNFCRLWKPARIILSHPTTWRVAQAIYVLLGWLIVSMSILTISAFVSRQAEGES